MGDQRPSRSVLRLDVAVAVRRSHRRRYKLKRQRDGVSPRTINLEITLISVMFKIAVQWGYAHRNPITDVAHLKEPKRQPRYLSQEEARRLLDAAKDTYIHSLIVAALHTGMRRNELFNLRWEDINFESNTITVQPKRDWHTKNYDYRVLEMTEMLRDVLQKEHERKSDDQEYVFTYAGARTTSGVRKTFTRVVRTAGLKDVTPHTLQHTFASHLAMAGVPLMHLQQLMGHSDYSTTLVYAHISAESHKGQVHRLPYGSNDEESE